MPRLPGGLTVTENEARNVLVRAGAQWVDEAIRDNRHGPVTMHTTIDRDEIDYEVSIGSPEGGRFIWSKTVKFGDDAAHRAAGAAFVAVAREQDSVAFAALHLLELADERCGDETAL